MLNQASRLVAKTLACNIKCRIIHRNEAKCGLRQVTAVLLLLGLLQSTLDQLHRQFLLILESLSEFWDVLDQIDSNTWILEPEKPSRSDTMRRIAIGMKEHTLCTAEFTSVHVLKTMSIRLCLQEPTCPSK